MFCIVLVIELAGKNVLKELGVFIDGIVQGYSFRPPKKYKPSNKLFGAHETCTEMCGTLDGWITVSLQTIFLELKRVKILQKQQQNASFLAVYGING